VIAGLGIGALALALAAARVAGFVRGLSGFGLALLLVPALSLAVLPSEAVVIANLLASLIGFLGLRKQVASSEKSAFVIAGVALLGLPLGLAALWLIPAPIARLLIALIAILAFVAVLLPAKVGHVPGHKETVATGLGAGVLTGFAGMPGPPVVPYYLRRGLEPAVSRASMMTVFLVTQLSAVLLALAAGKATLREFMLGAALFPAVLIGTWAGNHAFGRVSPTAWRGIAGAVLGASAIAAAVKLL
jgi:uncharacterized membrane protein YfcA